MHGEALHRVLLSIHLFGAFILLAGIGLLAVTMIGLRHARTYEGLRQALFTGRFVEKVMPFGTIFVLFGGVWMAFMKDPDYTWHSAWIITAFILVLIFSINGGANIGKKMERLAKEAAAKGANGPLPAKMSVKVNDPALHISAWLGVGIIFTFIILMVEKPNLIGSLVTIAIGAAVGLAANWLVAKSSHKEVPKVTTAKPKP